MEAVMDRNESHANQVYFMTTKTVYWLSEAHVNQVEACMNRVEAYRNIFGKAVFQGESPVLRSISRLNGRRYRQGRDLAEKATRRRIRLLGPLTRKCGPRPHLSGARGVRHFLTLQDYPAIGTKG